MTLIWERLPCGCLLGGDVTGELLYYRPCSLLCRYYLHFLAESKRHDNPVQTMIVDEL